MSKNTALVFYKCLETHLLHSTDVSDHSYGFLLLSRNTAILWWPTLNMLINLSKTKNEKEQDLDFSVELHSGLIPYPLTLVPYPLVLCLLRNLGEGSCHSCYCCHCYYPTQK